MWPLPHPRIGLTLVKSDAMSLVQNCISFDNIVLKTTNLVLCCCLIFASAVTSVIFKQIRDYSLLYEDGYFIWFLWFLLYFLELCVKLPSAQKAVTCFSLTFGLVGIFYFQSRTYFHVPYVCRSWNLEPSVVSDASFNAVLPYLWEFS